MRTATVSLFTPLPGQNRHRAASHRAVASLLTLAFAGLCALGLLWQIAHPLGFDPSLVLVGP